MKVLSGTPLAISDIIAVSRGHEHVTIDATVAPSMQRSRSFIEALASDDASVYGVTTGFGALATTLIPIQERVTLQEAILRSHAAGVGHPIDEEVVRAMMLLRARSLAAGYSGVRPVLVERFVEALNAGFIPWVPAHGSLGASGDLAPLAHIATALTGEGWAMDTLGNRVDAGNRLLELSLTPLQVDIKEGLALINGTDGMTAILSLILSDLHDLLIAADCIAAMSVEGLLGTDQAFRESIVALRPSLGQQASAANLRAMLHNSPIIASHRSSPHLVQDPYSLRCTPQVHGAARNVIAAANTLLEQELASVVDNPVVLIEENAVASTGNFHGQALAYAADMCAMVCADIAALSERRTNRMLDPARSQGLPAFLSPHPGTNSGYMIAQYTAAATVTSLRVHAAPFSVHSIATSAEQEDHVSMGWEGAMRTQHAVMDMRRVLAIEALLAAQALDLRRPLTPAAGTGALKAVFRATVPTLKEDRFLAPDIEAIEHILMTSDWQAQLTKNIGTLQ